MDRCSLKEPPEVPAELFEAVQKSVTPHLEAATPLGWATLSVYYSIKDSPHKALPSIRQPLPAECDIPGIPPFIRDNYRVEVVGKRPYGFEVGLPDKIIKSRWTDSVRTTIAKGDAESPDIFKDFLRTFPNLNAPDRPEGHSQTAIIANRRTKRMAAVMVRLFGDGPDITHICTSESIGSSVDQCTPEHRFVQIGNANGPHTPDLYRSLYNDYEPYTKQVHDFQEMEWLQQAKGHLAEVIVMAGRACRYSDIEFRRWPKGKVGNPVVYSVSTANDYTVKDRQELPRPNEMWDDPRTTVLGIKDLHPIAAFRVAIVGWQQVHYERWI